MALTQAAAPPHRPVAASVTAGYRHSSPHRIKMIPPAPERSAGRENPKAKKDRRISGLTIFCRRRLACSTHADWRQRRHDSTATPAPSTPPASAKTRALHHSPVSARYNSGSRAHTHRHSPAPAHLNNRRTVLEQGCRDADATRIVVIQKQRRRKPLHAHRVHRLTVAVAHLPAPVTAHGRKPFRIAVTHRAADVLRFRQHAHRRHNMQRITRPEKTIQRLLT